MSRLADIKAQLEAACSHKITPTSGLELIAALEAVEALHRRVPVYVTEAGDCKHGGDCESVEIDGESMCPDDTDGDTCSYCAELNAMEYPNYPCATIRAITETLR